MLVKNKPTIAFFMYLIIELNDEGNKIRCESVRKVLKAQRELAV